MTVEWLIDASNLRAARLSPPVSKSDAQRALVLARLLGRPDWAPLIEPLDQQPTDVQALARGLAALDGPEPAAIDCADGGAPFRILLGQAAISPKRSRFTGTPRLAARPHQPLLDALHAALGAHGFSAKWTGTWPLDVAGATRTAEPRFRISAAQSSQFATSLLLAAAALARRERRPWTVELLDATASAGYLDLTLRWLELAGFDVQSSSQEIRIAAQGDALPARIPGDWSALGYLLPIAWRTKSGVLGADLTAKHPDRTIVRLLADVGLTVVQRGDSLRVEGSVRGGLHLSGDESPDLLPTAAALACVLPEPSTLERVEILRGKESDRLSAIRDLIAATGGQSTLDSDRLHILPAPQCVTRFAFDSRGDHRLAMSAAMLTVLIGGQLTLREPEVVAKSFPAFWEQLASVGVRCGPVRAPAR